jgi:uncharacterized membrane protein
MMASRVLSLSAAIYVLLFFSSCCLKYYGFAYDDFDLAIHDQIVWNILHGSIFNSILGIDFLGNHVHFISFLVAPFYWLIPHPLFLLFLQTVFFAAGVYPLYALSRLYLDDQMSLITCLIYLLYPGLGYANLYEFHPTCFACFFLLCTAYYFYKENFARFSIFMILSLLCQENIALIFFMWGIYALFLKRQWKWVLWPTCLGLAYFLLCVYYILPAFNKNTLNFFSIYSQLGGSLGQIAKTSFFHPGKVLAIMFQLNKIVYLKQLFVGVSFLPLFSPLALLPLVLIFIQHLLSNRPSEVTLTYHYTAEMIPFIFVAFIFGARKIIAFVSHFKYLGWMLLLNALIVNLVIGPHLHLIDQYQKLSDPNVIEREKFIEQIPKDAPVVATFKFLSHLSHHPDLYSFHYVYSRYYTLSKKLFHLPDDVNYALIDFNDPLLFLGFYSTGRYRNIVNFLKRGEWGVMGVKDSVVLFKKDAVDQYPLFNFIGDGIVPSHPLNFIIDDRIGVLGYDALMRPGYMHLTFFWKLVQPEKRDVNLLMEFIDQHGSIIEKRYRPICYRIWPTQAWQINQTIEEHQYISISPALKARLKCIKIGFVDFKTMKSMSIDAKDALGKTKPVNFQIMVSGNST